MGICTRGGGQALGRGVSAITKRGTSPGGVCTRGGGQALGRGLLRRRCPDFTVVPPPPPPPPLPPHILGPQPGGSGASPTPAAPYLGRRPRLLVPVQLQPLPRRLPARFPGPGPGRRLRFHLPAAPLSARQPPHRRGAAAGRGARRAGQRRRVGAEPRRDTVLLLHRRRLPLHRGTGQGGLVPAAAATLGRGSGGRLRAAEEVGEAELGHGGGGRSRDRGPGSGPGAPTRALATPRAPMPPLSAGTRAAASTAHSGGREGSRGAELAPRGS